MGSTVGEPITLQGRDATAGVDELHDSKSASRTIDPRRARSTTRGINPLSMNLTHTSTARLLSPQ